MPKKVCCILITERWKDSTYWCPDCKSCAWSPVSNYFTPKLTFKIILAGEALVQCYSNHCRSVLIGIKGESVIHILS
jgi:hypothetical protein